MNYYMPSTNEFSVELPLYLIDNLFLSCNEDLLEVAGNDEPMYDDIYNVTLCGLDYIDGKSMYKLSCVNEEIGQEHEFHMDAYIFYKLVQTTELYEALQMIYYQEFFQYEMFSCQPKKVILKKSADKIKVIYNDIELFDLPITHFSEISNDSFNTDCEALVNKFFDSNILNF